MRSLSYQEISVLVEKSKQGDSTAFAALYQNFYQKIYFFSLTLVKNETIAEDVVQETFINAFTALHSLENNQLFTAWLNRIAYHAALRYLNKNRELLMDEAQMEALTGLPDQHPDVDPFEQASKQEQHNQILKAIGKLPKVMQTVVILHFFNNMKLDDIALIMDCPVGTVKSRLNTAKKRLRQTVLHSFMPLPISAALLAASRQLPMKSGPAYANGYSPAGNTAPVHSHHFATILTCGLAGVTLTGTLLLQMPKVVDLQYDQNYTSDPVSVLVRLDRENDATMVRFSDEQETIVADDIGGGWYNAFLSHNGSYTITTQNRLRTAEAARIEINNIDRNGPEMVSYDYTDNSVNIYLQDELSGVDSALVYAVLPDGQQIKPTHTDTAVQAFTFPLTTDSFLVYATDLIGNETEFLISIDFIKEPILRIQLD